jgi:hypothetical protein
MQIKNFIKEVFAELSQKATKYYKLENVSGLNGLRTDASNKLRQLKFNLSNSELDKFEDYLFQQFGRTVERINGLRLSLLFSYLDDFSFELKNWEWKVCANFHSRTLTVSSEMTDHEKLDEFVEPLHDKVYELCEEAGLVGMIKFQECNIDHSYNYYIFSIN